jgi:hypothetical protein
MVYWELQLRNSRFTFRKAFKFNEINIRNAAFTTPYQVGLPNKLQIDVGLSEAV